MSRNYNAEPKKLSHEVELGRREKLNHPTTERSMGILGIGLLLGGAMVGIGANKAASDRAEEARQKIEQIQGDFPREANPYTWVGDALINARDGNDRYIVNDIELAVQLNDRGVNATEPGILDVFEVNSAGNSTGYYEEYRDEEGNRVEVANGSAIVYSPAVPIVPSEELHNALQDVGDTAKDIGTLRTVGGAGTAVASAGLGLVGAVGLGLQRRRKKR